MWEGVHAWFVVYDLLRQASLPIRSRKDEQCDPDDSEDKQVVFQPYAVV